MLISSSARATCNSCLLTGLTLQIVYCRNAACCVSETLQATSLQCEMSGNSGSNPAYNTSQSSQL